jgi:hypothetical protein
VGAQGFLLAADLNGYATESYVGSQGFLTGNDLTGYATESYVGSQGFLTQPDLNGYATENYVGSQGFLKSADLNGYATESYVGSQGFLTSADLNPYATEAYVDGQDFLTSSDLNGYATEAWVDGQGFAPDAVGVGLAPYLVDLDTTNTGNWRLHSADGQTDELDMSGLAPGELRFSDNGRIAVLYSNGTTDTQLYFDIEESPSIACTLLHREDDRLRQNWNVATDGGNNVAGIWGNSVTATFMLSRSAVTGNPTSANSAFRILCM